MASPEVGPEHVVEDQLAVGQLPEEEVGDAVLARCADDQVRVGLIGVVEVGPEGALADLVGRDAFGHDLLDGIDDFGPAPVVERHGERAPSVVSGEADRLVHPSEHPLGHPPVAPPGKADADPFVVELVAPTKQQALVEPHEIADLVGRPAPVFGGEGVHGDPGDAEVEGPFDGIEEGGLTGRMALGPGQPPAGRPPPVAVHDTGHMGGNGAAGHLGRHDLGTGRAAGPLGVHPLPLHPANLPSRGEPTVPGADRWPDGTHLVPLP